METLINEIENQDENLIIQNEFEANQTINAAKLTHRLSSAKLKIPRNYRFEELARTSQTNDSEDEFNEIQVMTTEPLSQNQILEEKRRNAKKSFYGAFQYLQVEKQKSEDVSSPSTMLIYSGMKIIKIR